VRRSRSGLYAICGASGPGLSSNSQTFGRMVGALLADHRRRPWHRRHRLRSGAASAQFQIVREAPPPELRPSGSRRVETLLSDIAEASMSMGSAGRGGG